jgi:hypothetical protein
VHLTTEEDSDKFAHGIYKRMVQIKVFIALKTMLKKNKIKNQHFQLLGKLHEQEILSDKLECLLKGEVDNFEVRKSSKMRSKTSRRTSLSWRFRTTFTDKRSTTRSLRGLTC